MPRSRRSPAERLRDWVPHWWHGEGGVAGSVLDGPFWPLELLYRGGIRLRNLAYDRGWLRVVSPAIPTISVGNIAVGGAGKTPFSAWLAHRVSDWGLSPAIVLRGYGADEVLVHRELNPGVPVLTAKRRSEAVERAATGGADVAILDDAFQHRALDRDLDIVLLAAESWTPRRRLLPRGPWREGVQALRRADFVLITRKTAPAEVADRVAREIAGLLPPDRIAVGHIHPTCLTFLDSPDHRMPLSWLRGRSLLAVASLADPRAFVAHLRDYEADVELLSFPDHHDFSRLDVERIVAAAGGRALVMTRKEAVKLRPLLPPEQQAVVLEQQVEIEAGKMELEHALRKVIAP